MTQIERVIKVLKRKPLTQLQAYKELGITRLGARIWDLQEQGVKIRKKWVNVRNRHGESCRVVEYSL